MDDKFDSQLIFPDSQFDDDTRFEVVLLDNEHDGQKNAVLKSSFSFQGSNKYHDTRFMDENIRKSGLTVQGDLAQIIHGTMVKGGSPATLIVFQFAFVPRGNHQRFKKAEISVEFSAGNVHSITPKQTWTTMRSEKQSELSHSVSPGLEAAFGPGKATMGYTWQLKESQKTESHSTVVGITQQLGQAGSSTKKRTNTALWGLYENPETKSGIPSFLQTAVLLECERSEAVPSGQRSSAKITISGEVDNSEWVKDKWKSMTKKMSGESTKGEHVIFDKELNLGGIQDTHNMTKVPLDTYKQLVTIRPWVDGDTRAPSQAVAVPDGIEQTSTGQPAEQVTTNVRLASTPLDPKIAGSTVQDLANKVAQNLSMSGSGDIPQEQTAASTLDNSVLAELMNQDDVVDEKTAVLSGCEKQQRLHDLEDQLSLVRSEARVMAQLINLIREERRLLKEVSNLKN
jgi:hypothetical protein